MTAEQFEAEFREWHCRRSSERPAPSRVETLPSYVEGWEHRTRMLTDIRDRTLALVEADPHRRGNYLLLQRVDECDAELWLLALVRHNVQQINAAPAA